MSDSPSASPARASDTASPCVSVCTLDAARRVCVGCFRTVDEIAAWSGLADEEKRAINAQLAARRCQHEESHGKR